MSKVEISGNKKIQKKISESCIFEETNKIDKPLARLTKEHKLPIQRMRRFSTSPPTLKG